SVWSIGRLAKPTVWLVVVSINGAGSWADGRHPVADVIEARMPANKVPDVLNHKLSEMGMRSAVAARDAAIDLANRHNVRRVVVTVPSGLHIQADNWILRRRCRSARRCCGWRGGASWRRGAAGTGRW